MNAKHPPPPKLIHVSGTPSRLIVEATPAPHWPKP